MLAECAATNPFPSSRTNASSVGALLGGEIDLADAEEEDRVEVVQGVRQELLAGGDARAGPKAIGRLVISWESVRMNVS